MDPRNSIVDVENGVGLALIQIGLEHEQEQNVVLTTYQHEPAAERQAKNGSIDRQKYMAAMGYTLEEGSGSIVVHHDQFLGGQVYAASGAMDVGTRSKREWADASYLKDVDRLSACPSTGEGVRS